jgi:hypothetical protein
MAGIAFISNFEPETLVKMFDGLFGLISLRPRVIRTVQKQSLEAGMNRVVAKYPDITYLPDLTKVLVNLKRHLNDTEENQAEILSIVN